MGGCVSKKGPGCVTGTGQDWTLPGPGRAGSVCSISKLYRSSGGRSGYG